MILRAHCALAMRRSRCALLCRILRRKRIKQLVDISDGRMIRNVRLSEISNPSQFLLLFQDVVIPKKDGIFNEEG